MSSCFNPRYYMPTRTSTMHGPGGTSSITSSVANNALALRMVKRFSAMIGCTNDSNRYLEHLAFSPYFHNALG